MSSGPEVFSLYQTEAWIERIMNSYLKNNFCGLAVVMGSTAELIGDDSIIISGLYGKPENGLGYISGVMVLPQGLPVQYSA